MAGLYERNWVDPGIDHMSAMQVIDRIKSNGGKMLLFESFCGGIVAPESDTNLWNYKFTWNPRNVVWLVKGVPRCLSKKAPTNTFPIINCLEERSF